MTFTPNAQQALAITNRGGETLVSAAAGSGKTRVLVERLLTRICDENCDITDFLIITFTKAAAAELRTRIAKEISSRLSQTPDNRHLQRQAALVYQAKISTIHAFCSSLLRESGHLIGIAGDFRLMDENEVTIRQAEVLEQVLEEKYETLQPDDPFCLLVDSLAAGRDDRALAQIVLDIFGRVQSHANPHAWLAQQAQQWRFDEVSDAGSTPWGQLILTRCKDQATYYIAYMEKALSLCQNDEILLLNYGGSIQETIQSLHAFLAALDKSWDAARDALPIQFPKAGAKKGISDTESANLVKAMRNRCKKKVASFDAACFDESANILSDLAEAAPIVDALMSLITSFSLRFSQEKRKNNLLDFSDLEHLALALLQDEKTGSKTALAALWSARFVEVMVDEYQDTNQVQNEIFNALSDNGQHLFMVGDVKQSIYRFRLADPTIFLKKFASFSPAAHAVQGQARSIVLSTNYRSRRQVLSACNNLFRAIMTVSFAEIDYTDDHALIPAPASEIEAGYETSLALLDLSFQDQQDDLEKIEREENVLLEARWIARKIRAMLESGFLVSSAKRPLVPSDVMILLRSPGPVLHHYIRALEEEDIPWQADSKEDIFDSMEVSVALSLLSIVDNPRQDVPLLAVLRSPVFQFSPDKLISLRQHTKKDFYDAICAAAQQDDAQCAAFLSLITRMRTEISDLTLREAVWHIFRQAQLLSIFGAMRNGHTRQQNLLSLYALAGQMEQNGCKSLFLFLSRLEKLRKNKTPFPNSAREDAAGGVSIMSIHGSKGLESPVVFVSNLSKQFNTRGFTKSVLFHPDIGIGTKGFDMQRKIEYPTLSFTALSHKLRQEMNAEELRLLYVAMTRAQDKLFLTVHLPKGAKTLKKLEAELSLPPSPTALENQTSVGSWILMHALTRPEAQPICQMADISAPLDTHTDTPWEITWEDCRNLSSHHAKTSACPSTPPPLDADKVDALVRRLAYQYPYRAQTLIPSKLTATELKGRILDAEIAQDTNSPAPAPLRRPDFIVQSRGLSPAERGTAIHLALQYLPNDTPADVKKITKALSALCQDGFLTNQQLQAISAQKLCHFYASSYGALLSAAKRTEKEYKFSLLVPANEYIPDFPDNSQEMVLFQGVIDCWCQEDDGITIIDFKSDFVTPENLNGLSMQYTHQLNGYSAALARILNVPIKKRVLWFFALDKGIEV